MDLLVEERDTQPETIYLMAEKVQTLRYGENPHQEGCLYRWANEKDPFEQLGGKELSYNNLLDVEVAFRIASEFSSPCVAIIKHNTPCGVATDEEGGITKAFEMALGSDPVSAFGSVIAVNREVTLGFVEGLGKLFVEVLISNDFSPEALDWLKRRKKNCRVLKTSPGLFERVKNEPVIRSVISGILVQSPDNLGDNHKDWKVVTHRWPSCEQMKELSFAWRVAKHVKSNAIVFVRGSATVGIGTGQPNRVDAVVQAAKRADEKSQGSVLASDAFFPFPDGIEEAVKAGVVAVIQPGGSIRDQEVIDKANELGIAMVFTGNRHFRH